MASIVQRKGKYCVVYLYTNDEGKRKQKWEIYKTYDEAKKRREEVEYRAQIGKLVMPKCVTMEDLIREFIANYGKINGCYRPISQMWGCWSITSFPRLAK